MKTIVDKLNKARGSIESQVRRGATQNAKRSVVLVCQYNELKLAAIRDDVWGDYCSSLLLDPSHSGVDFFA